MACHWADQCVLVPWLHWHTALLAVTAILCVPMRCHTGEYALKGIAKGQLKRLHGSIDAEGDGLASLEELLDFAEGVHFGALQQAALSNLRHLDADGDGVLSLGECLHGPDSSDGPAPFESPELPVADRFALADRNANGELSEDEAALFFHPEVTAEGLDREAAAKLRRADGDADSQLSPQEAAGLDDLSDHFRSLDADGDGLLSLEEFRCWLTVRYHAEGAMRELLDFADEDNNGHLSASELEGARGRMQGSNAEEYFLASVDGGGL